MPGKDLNYRITVDQTAGSSGIRDFSRTVTTELRKVDQSLDDTATASQKAAATLTKMADAAEAELKQASAAAAALATALGPEMAAKLGQNGIAQAVGDLNRMGVAFSDIEADADQLAAAMKRVDEVQVSAADAGLGNLNGRLNETDDAALKARNSLANMFGNTAQDASSLFGNLGSLGVGIGQLAEGAADAALGGQSLTSALAGTVAMAAPIAALAGTLALIGEVMSANAAGGKAQAAAVKMSEDAFRKGGDAAANYADSLSQAEEITVHYGHASVAALGGVGEFISKLPGAGSGILRVAQDLGLFGEKVQDITPLLQKAGVSAEQWAAAVAGGQQGYGDFAQALTHTSLSAKDQANILDGLTNSQADYSEGARNAANFSQVFGDKTDKTADAVERQARALDRAKTATDDLLASVDAEADARQRAADATRDQADAINAQIDAATHAADSQLAVTDALVKYGDVLKDHKASTEDVRDAALSLAKAQVQLGTDQAAAAGHVQTATEKIDAQNAAYLATAKTAKGPARDAVLAYIATLNGIDPAKVTEIIPNIDDMSLEEAAAALAGVSKTRTAAINADAHTAQAEQQIDQLTRDRYLDVYFRYKNTQVPTRNPTGPGGPLGPPILLGAPAPAALGPAALGAGDPAAAAVSGGAVVSPFVVDVGVSAAPTSLTLDMRGAILGSRYDVTRTVRNAVRDGVRLAGARGLGP